MTNEARYTFVPKVDITVFEIARILMECKITCNGKGFEDLDYNIARHFKKVEENEESASNPNASP
jgi:hypothetical protein